MKEVKSVDELEKLANGTDKEKKIAATYGYQPILDKLVKDESTDVAKFAKVIDADEDLKLFKNDQENDRAKAKFNTSYDKYRKLWLATIITVIIAAVMEIIAMFTLFGSYKPSIWFWCIGGIIVLAVSLVLGYFSNKAERQYKNDKHRLSQTSFIFEASKQKFDNLQDAIEKGTR